MKFSNAALIAHAVASAAVSCAGSTLQDTPTSATAQNDNTSLGTSVDRFGLTTRTSMPQDLIHASSTATGHVSSKSKKKRRSERRLQALAAWTQVADIIVENPSSGNCVVSSSADSGIVAVGLPKHDANGRTDSGMVQVYAFDGTAFHQRGSTLSGTAGNDLFGHDVSLSDDGSTLIIGIAGSNSGGINAGAVRVYRWDEASTDWIIVGSDLLGDVAGDRLGWSVDIDGPGDTVVAGALYNDDGGNNRGHVKVFAFDGTDWVQKGDNIVGEASGDWFGFDVGLAKDGSMVVVGANGNDGNGSQAGHVRVLKWSDSTSAWMQIGFDVDGESTLDGYGHSVSINRDGTIIAVGVPMRDVGGAPNSGYIQVFQLDGTSLTQLGNNIDGGAAEDRFGYSVALDDDGTTLVGGAPGHDGGGDGAGLVRVFSFDANNGDWAEMGAGIEGETPDESLGWSVSIGGNSTRVHIGAPGNTGAMTGRVKAFDAPVTLAPTSTPTTTSPTLAPLAPTPAPTVVPSVEPSVVPSAQPTVAASEVPSGAPSFRPSASPSVHPLSAPSATPSSRPSDSPSHKLTATPSNEHSGVPSSQPTVEALDASESPGGSTIGDPSSSPSAHHSSGPSAPPSIVPSDVPSDTTTAPQTVAPTPAYAAPTQGPVSPSPAPVSLAPQSVAPTPTPVVPTPQPSHTTSDSLCPDFPRIDRQDDPQVAFTDSSTASEVVVTYLISKCSNAEVQVYEPGCKTPVPEGVISVAIDVTDSADPDYNTLTAMLDLHQSSLEGSSVWTSESPERARLLFCIKATVRNDMDTNTTAPGPAFFFDMMNVEAHVNMVYGFNITGIGVEETKIEVPDTALEYDIMAHQCDTEGNPLSKKVGQKDFVYICVVSETDMVYILDVKSLDFTQSGGDLISLIPIKDRIAQNSFTTKEAIVGRQNKAWLVQSKLNEHFYDGLDPPSIVVDGEVILTFQNGTRRMVNVNRGLRGLGDDDAAGFSTSFELEPSAEAQQTSNPAPRVSRGISVMLAILATTALAFLILA